MCLPLVSRGWRGRVACPAGLTRRGSRPPRRPEGQSPRPRHPRLQTVLVKCKSAFGRSDISGCSGAVHGSPFLAGGILGCHAAVAGDLADQVVTKTVSGSRFSAFFSGLLRADTQREQRLSCWCGDLEAGGRASAAGRRFRAWVSLDAFFKRPRTQAGRAWHQQFSRQ